MFKEAKNMKAVCLNGHGDFDKLQIRDDIPIPTPEPTEVLIKVSATAVNNTDINTRLAWYSQSGKDCEDASWSGSAIEFPRIQGADVCGQIVGVGKDVSTSRIGERVLIEPCIVEAKGKALEQAWYFGSECDGGFAEYTVVASRHAYKINSQLSDVQLASFPCSYSTAENMLTKTRTTQEDTVLITGASGGVGSAAVQLAKARGAKVIAVTSAAKAEKILSMGADEILLRDDNLLAKIGKNSIDVVLDLVAGKQFPQLIDVLKPFGRYAVAGAIGGPNVSLDIRMLYLKDLSFYGCTVLQAEVFSNLIQHIEQGNIKPLVEHTFPLEKIIDAQKTFLKKQHVGKIVLTVE